MGIAEEYVKKVKVPLIYVTITRFLDDDVPSVDGRGNNYHPEVVSCDMSYGFDQGSATCTLVIKTPSDIYGNEVHFEPMDRVVIEQGWNKTSTFRTTFFGFVDQVELSNAPQEQQLECRDILKLAQDNYLIHSNRKVYSKDPSVDQLDEDGDPMGGQDYEDRTAQAIITDLLAESGIPEDRLELDFIDYPASGAIVIGNNSEAVFEYESALDGVNRICDLIGYRIWADPTGQVQCREVSTIASETSAVTYRTQEETYDAVSGWVVTVIGNLLSIRSTVDDDLRNWVTVIGYDDLTSTVAGESEYVANPPQYRRTEIRSYLLDTQELVTAVAQRTYTDLNRLRYTATASIEGDPRLEIGMTVGLRDAYATDDIEINYILYDYSSRFSAGQWTMDLTLVGGASDDIPGSPPAGNVSPVAVFDARVEREFLPNEVITEVFVDARDSYDPDGDASELSYLWVCSGYDDDTGIVNSYTISGELTYLTVTLTVTDNGNPQLNNTRTHTITWDAGEDQVEWKTIFVASGDTVYSTDNGGARWVSKKLY